MSKINVVYWETGQTIEEFEIPAAEVPAYIENLKTFGYEYYPDEESGLDEDPLDLYFGFAQVRKNNTIRIVLVNEEDAE